MDMITKKQINEREQLEMLAIDHALAAIPKYFISLHWGYLVEEEAF